MMVSFEMEEEEETNSITVKKDGEGEKRGSSTNLGRESRVRADMFF